MRHEAIEMVSAHVGQGPEPPPHHSDVLGVSAKRELFIPQLSDHNGIWGKFWLKVSFIIFTFYITHEDIF